MSDAEMIVWVAGATALWLTGYAIACRFWPYGNCRRCKGGGRKQSPSGKYWRPCRKCKGSGTRIRTGRRFWNWVAGTAHKAVG